MALTLPNNFLMVNGITPANISDYLQAKYCNVDENEGIADVMWGADLDVSSVINNTFNAPNVLFPEYSEFAQFIFDLKLISIVLVLSCVCFLTMLFLLIEVNRDNKRNLEE
mgnify:CR=1 FL=1